MKQLFFDLPVTLPAERGLLTGGLVCQTGARGLSDDSSFLRVLESSWRPTQQTDRVRMRLCLNMEVVGKSMMYALYGILTHAVPQGSLKQ